jgi:thioredoxin-related protein
MKKLLLPALMLLSAFVFSGCEDTEISQVEEEQVPRLADEPASEKVEAVWLTDFEAAKKLAAEKNLPILVNFSGSDWCGWCIKLDNEVFSQDAFKAYANENLVLFLADFPNSKPQPEEVKVQNDALTKTYGVRGFPTVLLLDAGGNVLARTGYQSGGADPYVEHIRDLLK